MRLAGKSALITGGSSGIGLALVERFLCEGARVAFTYRTAASLERPDVKRLREHFPDVRAIAADFSQPSMAAEVMDEACAQFGLVNVLVNNAATFTRDRLIDTRHGTLDHVMNVNFIAPFLLVSAFARNLIEQARPGSIVNVSSLSATVSRGEMAAYQCSKAALEMLSKSTAHELSGMRIRSNVIAPGLVETPANLDQRIGQPEVWARRMSTIPLGRAGMPSDLTAAAVYLASDEAVWVTGCRIVIDGGASTF